MNYSKHLSVDRLAVKSSSNENQRISNYVTCEAQEFPFLSQIYCTLQWNVTGGEVQRERVTNTNRRPPSVVSLSLLIGDQCITV